MRSACTFVPTGRRRSWRPRASLARLPMRSRWPPVPTAASHRSPRTRRAAGRSRPGSGQAAARQPRPAPIPAELRAEPGHAADHDSERIDEPGQAARNPLQVRQPFLLIPLGLLRPADPPGPPPQQAAGQGPGQVSRLIDQEGNHDGGHHETRHPGQQGTRGGRAVGDEPVETAPRAALTALLPFPGALDPLGLLEPGQDRVDAARTTIPAKRSAPDPAARAEHARARHFAAGRPGSAGQLRQGRW